MNDIKSSACTHPSWSQVGDGTGENAGKFACGVCGAIGREMRYLSVDAALAAPAPQPGGTVLYQRRGRPNWDAKFVGDWEFCSAEAAADHERTPVVNDWTYEVRRLRVESPATAAPAPQPELVGYLPAYELDRVRSGHDGRLRSAKFGPSELDGDIPVYAGIQSPSAQPEIPDGYALVPIDPTDAMLAVWLTEAERSGGQTGGDTAPWTRAIRRYGDMLAAAPKSPSTSVEDISVLAAARRLAARGWFEPSTCADTETASDMQAMRDALERAPSAD